MIRKAIFIAILVINVFFAILCYFSSQIFFAMISSFAVGFMISDLGQILKIQKGQA